MKVKRLTKLFIACMLIAFMLLNVSNLSAVIAVDTTEGSTTAKTISLGATLWRENEKKVQDEPSLIAYKAKTTNKPKEEVRVWKLVEQEVSTDGTSTENTMNMDKVIYCLNAGVGFTDMSETGKTNTTSGQEYNVSYNMYDETQIRTEMGWDDVTYSKIMWLIENMYVNETMSSEQFLKNIPVSDPTFSSLWDKMQREWTSSTLNHLTDADIEVVQQMALWYFTNEKDPKYNNTELEQSFTTLFLEFKENITDADPSSEDSTKWKGMADRYNEKYDPATGTWEKDHGSCRQEYATELFKYLITEAEKNGNYTPTKMNQMKATFWTHSTDTVQQVVMIEKGNFDLALRKYITEVSDGTYKATHDRTPEVDTTKLNTIDKDGNLITTADYKHRKYPVTVETGNIVTYNITIYNEGDIAGRATEIVDQLPDGLEYVTGSVSAGYTVIPEAGNKIRIKEDSTTTHENLEAYDGGDTLDSVTISIECKVNATAGNNTQYLTNIAWIDEAVAEGEIPMENVGDDRDSEPQLTPPQYTDTDLNNSTLPGYKGNDENKDNLTDDDYFYKGQQDDDDFEKLELKGGNVDFALRKFITKVETTDEDGKTSETTYSRAPEVDTTKLNTIDKDGNLITTADYNHSKMPVPVKIGDIVTYTIRVYNEGNIDGYVSEITDHLPEWLTFLGTDELNTDYLWDGTVSADGRTIKTDITSKENSDTYDTLTGSTEGTLLKAYTGGDTLDFVDVQIKCQVNEEAKEGIKMTNIAEISGMTDSEENIIDKDRDSQADSLTDDTTTDKLPTDSELPNYKDDEMDQDYVPGQEDDDDFEKVIIPSFDLALRKFITDVDGMPVNNRYPKPRWDNTLNRIVYEHPPKTPVDVVYEDVVTYTIRVYNEGTQAGFAQEVTDDLPEYLTFLPDNEINKQYGWVMRDKDGNEVDDVEDAVCITTDYLSKENGIETTTTNDDGTTTTTNSNLLQAFNKEAGISENNPDYRDVKVAMRVDFQVTLENKDDSKRVLINEAQISKDADENGNEVEDADSVPNRDDKYNYDGDNEDDIDYEPVKVKYFDLALKKWVTQAIVTENGKTTITESGHTGEENPEPAMKVEIKSKSINKVNVKFKFNIKVTNEGEIAGYATEVTDHVPEGLEFKQEDNPNWYTKEGNLVATKALENTLLQPGESATVEIVLTWINGNENFGLKTNYAEISEDYNTSGTPDIDSTPDNLNGEPVEDDEDQAPVVLSIKTGEAPMYIALTTSMIGMFTGGVCMIKKYVI